MHLRDCNSDPIHLGDPIYPSLRYSPLILFITNYQPENFRATSVAAFLSRRLTATFTFYAEDFARFTARGLRASRLADRRGETRIKKFIFAGEQR